MAEKVKPIEELTFREAMTEMDQIIATLESNTLELEDSLISFERGIALYRNLNKRMDEAQQKVESLMGEISGIEDDSVRDSTLS